MSQRQQSVLAWTNPLAILVGLVLVLAAVAVLASLLMYGLYLYAREEVRTRPGRSNPVTNDPLAGHETAREGQTVLRLDPSPDTVAECTQCGIALGGLTCEVCSAPKGENASKNEVRPPSRTQLRKLSVRELYALASQKNDLPPTKIFSKTKLIEMILAAARPDTQTPTRRRVRKRAAT